MRILISGDSHADYMHLTSIQSKMEKFECDLAFVVGDFGFWPRDKAGIKFLNRVSSLDFPVYFIDGNHEDHDILDRNLEGYDFTDFIEVHPNCFFAPRGFRWEWDDVKFMSLGGAYSVDRARRVKFIDWFPRELIDREDVINCLHDQRSNDPTASNKVDIMLTHDVPSMVDLAKVFITSSGENLSHKYWFEEETEINRNRIQAVVDAVQPELIIHGHWHHTYTEIVQGIKVIGLNCNKTNNYFTILDTKEFKEQHGKD